MAFFSKVGNVFGQTGKRLMVSNSSMLQSMRSMSSSKVFVGGISYSTDEFGLKQAFSKYGEVVEARVIVDRETGKSRGFGFVTFTSSDEASGAIQEMDGQDLHGRRIRVNYATDRGSGFGGPGGGGFRNANAFGTPASGYGGPAGGYGGPAAGYGGGPASGYGGGYGVAGGVGGSDGFPLPPRAETDGGFGDKFGNDGNDHRLGGGFGSENEFDDPEDGKSTDSSGLDSFDGDNEGDTDFVKRA
ncbi:PREDICTED: glycine-rich RNA-binding protein 5, mitochondrial [Tarenaya hassleriana]|uniref:glycine-rich RNA-binding protein 5, mitochondrial n=1 Tax=Tarenaya hassleriana TaxID=28532 RepID=UPI00053C9ED9|nr:PREDICTED: glycine-rich RNA-binding protein 5, mitochondrial [Tarenaya hassleriana]